MESFEEKYYEAESFWANGAVQDEPNLKRIAKTIECVPNDVRSLLDVGCGNGVFGHNLHMRKPEITLCGVDRSSAALNYVRFDKRQASIDSLPFADSFFDCVTCLQVIEHLPVNIFEKALSELSRVAGKYIIIGVPYREVLENGATRCPSCRSTFNIDLHLRSFGISEITELFMGHGFRLDHISYPDERTRKKYLHYVTGLIKKAPKLRPFDVPICPVCGYSEGDKSVLSVAASRDEATASRASGYSILRRNLKRVIDPLWPTEDVPGYWAICRYVL